MKDRIVMLGLAGLLAACAADTAKEQDQPAAGSVTAPPLACVALSQIREARVVDDHMIDFHLRDGRLLRNRLPHQCPGLGAERAFSYAASLTHLCSADSIRVVHQSAGPRLGASCGLGPFTPQPQVMATGQ